MSEREMNRDGLYGGTGTRKQALVIIDIQNDITKNYRDIIGNINRAIDWAVRSGIAVAYVKHENASAGTRTFKPGTKGFELVPELNVVSEHVFTKTKGNALTSPEFIDFIQRTGINEFLITGADAVACVKSTCYNLRKASYTVTVLSDCVTSYDKTKITDMLRYYQSKGCAVKTVNEWVK